MTIKAYMHSELKKIQKTALYQSTSLIHMKEMYILEYVVVDSLRLTYMTEFLVVVLKKNDMISPF